MENRKKDFIWNFIGSSINSFNSLFFMIAINHINLKSEAGVFTFAYSLICLFFILSTFYNRVYQISNYEKYTPKDFIDFRILTSILTIIIVAIFSFINNYNFFKTGVILLICLFRMIESISDAVYGILQKNNQLYKSGISLTVKGVVGIIAFVITDLLTKSILISLVSLIIVNILLFFIYDIKNAKEYIYGIFNFDNLKKILKDTLPIFIYSFLAMYVANSSKYILDYFDTAEAQNIFGIIFMPSTIIGLCSSYIVVPIITNLNNLFKNKDIDKFNKLVRNMMLSLIFIGILACLCGLTIGIPVLNIMYGIDLNAYRLHLVIVLIGATFYTLANVYSQVLVLLNVHKEQTIIYLIMTVVSTIICYVLISIFKLTGAIYAYLVFMAILLIMYLFLYYRTLKKYKRN